MRHICLFFLVCSIGLNPATGQNLLTSRQSGYYEYVYRISAKEYGKIQKARRVDPMRLLALTPQDSFPVDSPHLASVLRAGYYMKIKLIKDELVIEAIHVPSFSVFVLTNDADLCLQVVDSAGGTIRDAVIKEGGTRIGYDKKTNSYRAPKSNRQGRLMVVVGQDTCYYMLERDINASDIKRFFRAMVYRWPTKYVFYPVRYALKPVKFVIRLPIDIVNSFKYGRPVGKVYRLLHFYGFFPRVFRNVKQSVGYWEFRGMYGYTVLNKPMYRPGDTVFVKAYICNRHGKPLNQMVEVALGTYAEKKIMPSKPGHYETSFVLKADPKMPLDQRYTIDFYSKRLRSRMYSTDFDYKDYELSKIILEATLKENKHYRGQKFAIQLRAQDENNLCLPDARYAITVRSQTVSQVFESVVYCPDKLWTTSGVFRASGETEIAIPDSIFPPANMTYSIDVELNTSENHRQSYNWQATFVHRELEIRHKAEGDSIRIGWFVDGQEMSCRAMAVAFDYFNHPIDSVPLMLPACLPVDPYCAAYKIITPSLSKTIRVSELPTGIKWAVNKTQGRLTGSVYNPRNIPIVYYLYKSRRLIKRGNATDVDFSIPYRSNKVYSLSYHFLWGGKVREETYEVAPPPRNERLNLSVQHPDLVCPGQKASFTVMASDVKGKPVKNLDISSVAITDKFSGHIHRQYERDNYLNTHRQKHDKHRPYINSFTLSKTRVSQKTPNPILKHTFPGIDTVPYYRFIYPFGTEPYRFEYTPSDSLAQFAPFVFRNGRISPVYAIWVDRMPVYVNHIYNLNPYSIRVDTGYHEIKLRTSTRLISISKVYFPPHKKVVISLDETREYRGVTKQERQASSIYQEIRNMGMLVTRDPQPDRLAWVEQGESLYLLTKPTIELRQPFLSVCGPLRKGPVTYTREDSFSINFDFEPEYEYWVKPGLIKMRCRNNDDAYKGGHHQRIEDEAISASCIEAIWREYRYLLRQRQVYYSAQNSRLSKSLGKLHINSEQLAQQADSILSTIVAGYAPSGNINISGGLVNTASLSGETTYSVFYLYKNGSVGIIPQISIKPEQTTYLINPDVLMIQEDDWSRKMNSLFEAAADSAKKEGKFDFRFTHRVWASCIETLSNIGFDRYIFGVVRDKNARPVSNVMVTTPDRKYQTQTNEKGRYSLWLPATSRTLIFSTTDKRSRTINVDGAKIYNVNIDSTSSPLTIRGMAKNDKDLPLRNIRICDKTERLVTYTDSSGYFATTVPDTITTMFIGSESFYTQCFDLGCDSLYTFVMSRFAPKYPGSGSQNDFLQVWNALDYNEIEGYVTESDTGEPLPGVTITFQGATGGTISDYNGYFRTIVPEGVTRIFVQFVGYESQLVDISLTNQLIVELEPSEDLIGNVCIIGYAAGSGLKLASKSEETVSASAPPSDNTIRIRGVGTVALDKQPLYVIDGKPFLGDITAFDMSTVANSRLVSNPEMLALYGSRAANGVLFITTLSNQNAKGATTDTAFINAAMRSSGIRSRFSDYAFWQPDLRTGKDGKVTFEVTFPDDVTKWNAWFLAMNRKRQYAEVRAQIKSYKPFMARLKMPRFLTAGDTLVAIGKALNYTMSPVDVTTSLVINDSVVFSKNVVCADAHIDSLWVNGACGDSLRLTYSMSMDNGYSDGEKRYIPVLPVGLEVAEGSFYQLDTDTTITLNIPDDGNRYTIYAETDALDVMRHLVYGLIDYRYLCNEQLASKLKALMAEKQICRFHGTEFQYEELTLKIIEKLLKNQNDQGGWSWWNKGKTEPWITRHVLEALLTAREMGYIITLNLDELIQNEIERMWSAESIELKIKSLKCLSRMDAPLNYSRLTEEFAQDKYLSVESKLLLLLIRQRAQLTSAYDTLLRYRKSTLFGNTYFALPYLSKQCVGKKCHGIVEYDRSLATNLLVYRILRQDSLTDPALLRKMRNYFLEVRSSNCYLNTWETANYIETIIPDLLEDLGPVAPVTLRLSGAVNQVIDTFPFTISPSQTGTIEVSKRGTWPVYLTAYHRFWEPEPEVKNDQFELSTVFVGTGDVLRAGSPVVMRVRLDVKKDAEYVMLEVPIPAGCSYNSTNQAGYWTQEVHREHYKDRVSIFCRRLQAGAYSFDISLLPRFTGHYTLNPAKAEQMYFPIFYGNNALRKVGIE